MDLEPKEEVIGLAKVLAPLKKELIIGYSVQS